MLGRTGAPVAAPLVHAFVLYIALAVGSFGLSEFDPLRLALMSGALLFAAYLVFTGALHADRWDVLMLGIVTGWILLAATRGIEPELWLPKLDGAVFGSLIVFIVARSARVRYDDGFDRCFLIAASIVLLLTLVYKLQFGLNDRTVRFFLNGPIVFGWMMGIACILSFQSWLRSDRAGYALLALVFIVAIVWSASKGPIIALVPALLACALDSRRWGRLALVGLAFYAAWHLALHFELLPERYDAIARALDGSEAAKDEGSVDLRRYMWDYSWTTFLDNPAMGVGLGNWSLGSGGAYLVANGMIYPHSLIYELLSEHGVMGTVLLLTAVLVAFVRCNGTGRCIMIFIFVGLMFTGDLSYWPFLIGFPLGLCRGERTR